MKQLIENKKAEILQLEKEKKIKRILAENAYQVVKKKLERYKFFSKVNYKYTSANKKLKIIDARIQKDYVSDVEALRHLLEEELQQNFKRKKLVFYKSDFKQANKLYFPYLFTCGEFKTSDEFLKVDIKACFYSIYSIFGIDVITASEIDHEKRIIQLKYVARGNFTKENSYILQLLEGEKTLRNSVYGLTRSSFLLKIYKNKVERSFFRGKLQNLDLTVLIASILHYIVGEIKKCVLYWNIDGGIIYSEGFEKLKNLCEMFKLQLKVEERSNECIILGLGSYQIGNLSTLHFRNGVCSHEKQKEYLYKVKNIEGVLKWLRKDL